MKYFETKHEKDSAKITALITVILVLLLFIVGQTYMDPPEEYGVAVNFGTTDFGSGNVQPKEPIKSTPQEVRDVPKEPVESDTPAEAEPKEATSQSEEVLTQENAEEIAMKKQKAKEAAAQKAKEDAEAREKAEAERVERERKEAAEKKRKEEEAKKKKLDEMMGGLNKSDGTASGSEG